ncbi:FAH family protein [Streptomyces sp. WMMC940]|uniref:FAH family protein n=1 Tax=Streptomyces sp. WMMC940 TaxID=3015153 RepID=UPI0022B68DFE|nr:FAH family protein [Streptomyces sp. WMMC940]MCZ7458932.1 FAH family protein [Streptomyces sp. WMMC940]
MNVLFECTYRNDRYFGLGLPADGEPLRLVPRGGVDLAGLLAEGAALPDAGTVAVPAHERHSVSFRPPLLPDSPGDAMVGGFMQTHNVKVDAETPAQPNWFLKGLGDVLRTSGEELRAPASSVALTEEAEVVLVYVTGDDRTPRYVGYGFGNDLTDIGRFRRHRGHLSYAKLCDAAVAPWLFLGEPPCHVTGHVRIERDGEPAWHGDFTTGTKALHYGLDDIVQGLFAFDALLAPGRVHYVYIGADRSSFHGGFRMADGDRVTLDFTSHGVTLSNTVRYASPAPGDAVCEGS